MGLVVTAGAAAVAEAMEMVPLAAVHSEAWYQGQLAAFLFRPNSALASYLAALKPRLAFNANHSRAAALAAMPGGLHDASCAAMHVRRTDKFRGRRREDARSQVGFARASSALRG